MRPSVCVQRRFQAHGASLFFFVPIVVPSNKICLEAVFYKFAELVQTLDIFIIELSVGHRGNIEIECGVRADGVEICVKESFEQMSLLGVPIEPARADGHINFRRSEYKTFGIYNILSAPMFWSVLYIYERSPARGPGLVCISQNGQSSECLSHGER